VSRILDQTVGSEGAFVPSEDLGDLVSEGEGVKGLEEDGGDAQTGETALIDSLNLCREQKDGDVGDGRVLLHVAEGGRTVDLGHHDIHEDSVGLLGDGDLDAFSARVGCEDLPTGCGLKGEGRYFADVVLIVDDQNASHERTYSLMRWKLLGVTGKFLPKKG
jgi:hypothetical protein